MTHRAIDVANAFVALSEPDFGDIMSNLKLQKLLYYTQGVSLAILNKPIFEEPVVAWEYGPVVENVYHAFRDFGAGAIEKNGEFDPSVFENEEIDIIKEVYEVYGQFSALKLMNMTHEEMPWKSTPRNQVITHTKLKQHFGELVE
jgi:uncharacterized phage-associated protein